MTTSEKLIRLDQFEILNKFGIFPDFELIKKARRASKALFDFDCLDAGGGKTEDGMETRIRWLNYNGEECERDEGKPHLFREYLRRGKDGKFTRDNWMDCGEIIDRNIKAIVISKKLSDWFSANGKPNVVAELTNCNCRYIKITDGKDYYALID